MPTGLTPEQKALAWAMKGDRKPNAEIARALGVKRKFVDFAFRRYRALGEPTERDSEIMRACAKTGLPYGTIYTRYKKGDRGERLERPFVNKAAKLRAKRLKRAQKASLRTQLYGKALEKPRLSDKDIELVRLARASKMYGDAYLSKLFDCELRDVQVIKPLRGFEGGKLTKYQVDDRRLTVPQIAKEASISRAAVYLRVQRGIRGLALLAPKLKGPRKSRSDKLTEEEKQDRKNPLNSRTGAPADFVKYPTPKAWRD